MFPVAYDDNETGGMVGVVSFVRQPGRGAIHMPGRFGAGVRDVVEVAVTWATTQVRALWWWLGRPVSGGRRRFPPALLWRSTETLVVGFSSGHRGCIDGGSLGAATALSLVSMLTRRRVKPAVAVTGLVDLSGNVLHVAGLRGKLWACWKREVQVDMLLVPQETLAEFRIESLPSPELRDYATRVLRGVRTMTDVIRLAILGR